MRSSGIRLDAAVVLPVCSCWLPQCGASGQEDAGVGIKDVVKFDFLLPLVFELSICLFQNNGLDSCLRWHTSSLLKIFVSVRHSIQIILVGKDTLNNIQSSIKHTEICLHTMLSNHAFLNPFVVSEGEHLPYLPFYSDPFLASEGQH